MMNIILKLGEYEEGGVIPLAVFAEFICVCVHRDGGDRDILRQFQE